MSTATTISKSFTASSTGNLIVVHLSWDGQTRSITAVSDSKGNAYARINGPTNWAGTNYRSELWYSFGIANGGTVIAVTATLSGAPASFFQVYMSEYSGMSASNPLDQKRANIGNTGAANSNTVVTLFTNELIYGVAIGESGTLATGTGFTNRSSANQNIVEDRTVSATGTYSSTFTSAGGNWVAEIATFKTTTSLPIELVDFNAQRVDNTVILSWTTASEKNNNYFSPERSEDGLDFMELSRIDGQGTSTSRNHYSFTDNDPPDSKRLIYYRLKQTDYDGSHKYSGIIDLACKSPKPGLTVFPNPTDGQLQFKFDPGQESRVKIDLLDSKGNNVYSSIESPDDENNLVSIDVSSLPAGFYMYEVSIRENLITGKFSKN